MTRPLCVLDANILIADRRLRGAAAVAFLRAVARGDTDAAVPWVALEEAIGHFGRETKNQRRALKETKRSLGRLGINWDFEFDPEMETSNYRVWLEGLLADHGFEILAVPEGVAHSIVRRELDVRKPFKPDGTGYRDALIWHSVLEVSARVDVLFVSNNSADFAASRKAPDQLAPDLVDELETLGGSIDRVRLVPSLASLLTILSGAEPDVAESLNHAFEQGRPVRDGIVGLLKEAILESEANEIEVEGPGDVVEVLQEAVHDLHTIRIEVATESDLDRYYLQMYVEADVDLYVTWVNEDAVWSDAYDEMPSRSRRYTSGGTSSTLGYTIEATYDRETDTFGDVRVMGSAHGRAGFDS